LLAGVTNALLADSEGAATIVDTDGDRLWDDFGDGNVA